MTVSFSFTTVSRIFLSSMEAGNEKGANDLGNGNYEDQNHLVGWNEGSSNSAEDKIYNLSNSSIKADDSSGNRQSMIESDQSIVKKEQNTTIDDGKNEIKNKAVKLKGKTFSTAKSTNHKAVLKFSAKYISIPHFFKRLAQLLTSSGYFWILVASCALAEPILCGFYPNGAILFAQKTVLIISSVLFVFQLVGVASTEWDTLLTLEEATSPIKSEIVKRKINEMTVLKVFIFFIAEGEYVLEFACLAIGWIFIFTYPGIAVLRCFRIFRLLW